MPDNSADDFDPPTTLRRVAASLDQPAEFAKIFCTAAETQKTIDNILKKNVKEVIRSDAEARENIKGLLREIEKEEWKAFTRKFFGLGWAILLIILGAVLQALSRKYLG